MSDLRLHLFDSPAALHEAAHDYLMANEAVHGLILGLIANLQVDLHQYGDLSPVFAAIYRYDALALVSIMTPPQRLVLSLGDLDAVDVLAEHFEAAAAHFAGVFGPSQQSDRFVDAWRSRTGSTIELTMAERLFRLDTLSPPANVEGSARRARAGDEDLIGKWFHAFELEAFGESMERDMRREAESRISADPATRGLYFWLDTSDQPVSMAGYGGPTPNSLRIGPVYTPPEHRGKGYGSAVTAATTQAVLDTGRTFVTLFTDLANPTSNSIYQKLGYKPIADFNQYTIHATP